MAACTVWFDGACSGNPGPMGAGAVVVMDGKARALSRAMGEGTNNQAEYHGLILGLRHALAAGADSVTVHGDSQLVLRQVAGRYRVNHEGLKPLHREAQALLARFARFQLEWVPREQNAAADRAARDALRP
ncbi:MAG: ribonuclease HI family protein [Thermoplasmatota archaeon]